MWSRWLCILTILCSSGRDSTPPFAARRSPVHALVGFGKPVGLRFKDYAPALQADATPRGAHFPAVSKLPSGKYTPRGAALASLAQSFQRAYPLPPSSPTPPTVAVFYVNSENPIATRKSLRIMDITFKLKRLRKQDKNITTNELNGKESGTIPNSFHRTLLWFMIYFLK